MGVANLGWFLLFFKACQTLESETKKKATKSVGVNVRQKLYHQKNSAVFHSFDHDISMVF